MGDILAVLSLIFALLVWYFLVEYKLSKLKTRIHMLDDIYVRKENAAAVVEVLEGLIRNLNAVCHDHRKRLDILEEDHPDDAIDFGTVDDDGNITEVWFNGKRYVPEDKLDENTSTLYADNKVVAETTRPEAKCYCATCKYYSPGVNHTCDMNPFKWVSSKNVACNKYKKTERGCYSATKGQVDYQYIKLNRIAGDAEVDELRKRIEKLNYICNTGLISVAEWERRWAEMMQNDT